jgi:glucose-6-phosphate isomerase
MTRAFDLLAHLPDHLDVNAKQTALRESLRIEAGALPMSAHAPTADKVTTGLFEQDPSVWKGDAAAQKSIANRLGWMGSPVLMANALKNLQEFAIGVRRDGFEHIVLLGMGGSSLAPEVLRAVVGAAKGWPSLQVLDSTDPQAVRAARTPPAQTLYILASKSGTTIEPNSLAAHFRTLLEASGVSDWASHFVAITDDGTELARLARTEHYRHIFLNPSDIGGRYSALSYFGLVPAALMGQDVTALVNWGTAMLAAATPSNGSIANPAAGLGLFMGAAARAGHDKLTLLLPDELEPFGLWVEQLVAESTGKAGVGIVPVAGETLGSPDVYGRDRAFVCVRAQASPVDDMVGRLAAAGFPVATIDLHERLALGAEFVRWEIATAVAGAVLGINPFDEPNVQQAKDATRKLLDSYQTSGRLPAQQPDQSTDMASLTLSTAARQLLSDHRADEFLQSIGAGDYCAVLGYVGPDVEFARVFHEFRMTVRDRTRAATMFGYGPRYLHSTGQLHKGGANTGVFVLVTASPDDDVPIPGQPFTFGTLELAQAQGDFLSLDQLGRRALHVHLAKPDPGALRQVLTRLVAG